MALQPFFSNDSDVKTTLQYQFPDEKTMCENLLNLTHTTKCVNGADAMVTTAFMTTTVGFREPAGVQMILLICVLPIVILLGSIGNAVTIYTIRTSPLKKYSVCIYMSAYCISNILSLTVNSGLFWLHLILPIQPFWDGSDTVCRLWHFFIHLLNSPGIWFVAAMVIDRFIIVWYPEKQKQMCTKFIAKLVVCIIIVGLVCIIVHALWTYSLNEDRICGLEESGDLQTILWSWTYFMAFSLIPIVIIFLFGNLLCVRLCWKNRTSEKRSTQVTNAAVIACCFYFFLKCPVIVIVLITNLPPQEWNEDETIMYRLDSFRELANFMEYVAYTTIFPVLCICCQEFRRRLVRKLSCCAKQNLHMECTAV